MRDKVKFIEQNENNGIDMDLYGTLLKITNYVWPTEGGVLSQIVGVVRCDFTRKYHTVPIENITYLKEESEK